MPEIGIMGGEWGKNMVNNDIYKKSGLMRMNIARDFYLMHPGERMLTISEYTEKCSVSRGIVQNAIFMPIQAGMHVAVDVKCRVQWELT